MWCPEFFYYQEALGRSYHTQMEGHISKTVNTVDTLIPKNSRAEKDIQTNILKKKKNPNKYLSNFLSSKENNVKKLSAHKKKKKGGSRN